MQKPYRIHDTIIDLAQVDVIELHNDPSGPCLTAKFRNGDPWLFGGESLKGIFDKLASDLMPQTEGK
jgi:hypothetical protein